MKSKESTMKGKDGDERTHKVFEAVYGDYIKRLNEIWETMTKSIGDAQKKFGDVANGKFESAEHAQKAGNDAQNAYVEAVRGAWDAAQKDYTGAYEDYVHGFREAWTKADKVGISPEIMALVTQSGSTAAGHAASTIGNWQLISWAGVPPWVLSPDQFKTTGK